MERMELKNAIIDYILWCCGRLTKHSSKVCVSFPFSSDHFSRAVNDLQDKSNQFI